MKPQFFCFCLFTLVFAPFANAQTKHPLLVQMRDNAAALPYGSYRLSVKEHYRGQNDTSRYFATCSFFRYKKTNDAPGLRFDIQIEGHAGGAVHQQRIVFDGTEKFEFRADSLAMIYDTRELGEEFIFRGLQNFFFVPLFLHEGQVQRFLGPDKFLGTPPYHTAADTVIGRTPCHAVVAQWIADTASTTTQYLAFFQDQKTGLVKRFVNVEWINDNIPISRVSHFFEITVEEFNPELPYNNFYIDWPGLPAGMEVRKYHDCQFKELIRSRQQQPGL